MTKKQIIVNAFEMGSPGLHAPGLWKHPDDQSPKYNTIEYWVELAKLLERGKFNAIFIADVLGPYDVFEGPRNIAPVAKSGAQWPIIEPSAAVSAMAAVTENLAFGVTISTISEAPYHLARRLSTLDHLTKGRIGWNLVTSYLDSAARNLLNKEPLPPHDERYSIAEEYLEVVEELLLSSWRDDAVVLDKKSGIYSDPERIREINHEGRYFNVPGPHILDPTPQRFPVLLQAGTSSKGKEFAAKNAEIVFIKSFTPENLALSIKDIRDLASKKYGREPDSIKFLQSVTTVIGKTHEEAEEKLATLRSYGDIEGAQALFSGWTGIDLAQFAPDEELRDVGSNAIKSTVANWTKATPGEDPTLKKTREYVASKITVGGLGPVIYGTAQEVADEIERWVDVSDVDGFNFTYAITPGTFVEIVDELLPELRKRNRVWEDYPKKGLTFRENVFGVNDPHNPDPTFFRPSHPAHKLRWTKQYSKAEFEKHLQQTKGSS